MNNGEAEALRKAFRDFCAIVDDPRLREMLHRVQKDRENMDDEKLNALIDACGDAASRAANLNTLLQRFTHKLMGTVMERLKKPEEASDE
jgi:hypothetical protein